MILVLYFLIGHSWAQDAMSAFKQAFPDFQGGTPTSSETNTPRLHREMFLNYLSNSATTSKSLYWKLWSHGLATLVAQRLNPEASWGDLEIGDQNTCEKMLPRLSRDFLKRFDSTREQDQYFYFSGPSKDAGRCLGFKVAERMARVHAFYDLPRLSETTLKIALKKVLISLR